MTLAKIKSAFVALALALGLSPSLASAQSQQPAQWNYTIPGNMSVATYPGIVNSVISNGALNLALFYGADPTGTNDSSSAFNIALSYINANAGVNELDIPAGIYKINSAITIAPTKPILIRGIGGAQATTIQLGTATQNGFNINSNYPVSMYDLTFQGASPTAGHCVYVTAPQVNLHSIWEHLTFSGCWDGLFTQNAAEWVEHAGVFLNCGHYCINVENDYNADQGDSAISDNFFLNNPSIGDEIFQVSSGGLKITNSKLLGAQYGYIMDLCASNCTTSDLLISNTSIENQGAAGIAFGNTTSTFQHVVITGDQFIAQPAVIEILDGGTAWLDDVNFSNNSIWIPANGTGINLSNSTHVQITGGYINCSAGTCYGISSGVGATGIISGVNNLASTPFYTSATGLYYPVTCSGTPSSSFATHLGVITHC